MKKAVLIFMLIAKVSFAQCFNAEKQYEEKVKEMIELCEKMKSVVPCAVGYSPNDYPHLDKVLSVAGNNALIELAVNAEAVVKYRFKDSAYTESDFYKDEDVAKRLGESVGKVKAEQIIKNTKSLKGECFSFTKNGKTLYRGASLRVFAELYDEWEQKQIKAYRPKLIVSVSGYNHDEFKEQLVLQMQDCNCDITEKKSEADFFATVKTSFKRCNNAEFDEIYCWVNATLAVSNSKSKKSTNAKIDAKGGWTDGNRDMAMEEAFKELADTLAIKINQTITNEVKK
jgi:hypothetical protein